MLEPWNNISLLPPPVHTSPSPNKIDVRSLKETCNYIIKILSKQSPLHKESAIMSRFLYKYDRKFRGDIGYRYLKKVNTALRRYLVLNVLKDIQNFSLALPKPDEDYLPTRQMLEYVLIRLITLSKIMLRICVCSKQASIYYLNRIKRGDNYWMSLMPYALVCRIRSMTFVLLQHCTHWYSCLYEYLDKLQVKGLEFLPHNYNLPPDFEVWLGINELDNYGRLEWSQKKQSDMDLSLEDEDPFDNILEYISQINNDDTKEELEIKTVPETIQDSDSEQLNISKTKMDHGEVISRESFNMLRKFQKKIDTDNDDYKHYCERVSDMKSLQQFMDMEEKFRNDSHKSSLTSHLSFMQWQALKNSLTNLCTPLFTGRKIERRFKKVWKEKCLDYV